MSGEALDPAAARGAPLRLSLNGVWRLWVAGTARPVEVPGCWEAAGVPKDAPGPFVYEREVVVPREMAGRRLWLRFAGVSYHAVVYLNAQEVGRHTGAWDAFEIDVSEALEPGARATLRVEVEKPASLRRGPASEPVPGRFPLKETLSGFLPYVWGHLFGGIWQDVWLEARGALEVRDAFLRTSADGRFTAEVALSASAACTLEILSPAGEVVAAVSGEGCELWLEGQLEHARPWHPADPVLYQARIIVGGETLKVWRFGFRSFEARGAALHLGGTPIYPRLALSWGWYPEALHSNPGRERVRADLLRLKALGFNGVKLCLWVPPGYYFDLADELGMLLWLELPMWLPEVTPFFKAQTPQEYARILRQVRQHPSLIMCSLGCELSSKVGAEVLGSLYHQAKALLGEVLLRDNSGSGEAYGGLLNEFADYYDYHFYSDLQFFAELLDTFAPRWRPVQPWVFGEFCDLDTFRDLRKLGPGGERPWWISADPALNPQGARWQYDLPFQEARLRANGFWERGAELTRISHRQALLHRKTTLELVRSYHEISGYVVTGERDTPISTAGMWDDLGAEKFSPEAFRAFNGDLVLTLGWDKRRAWVAGGDRAAYWDTFSYPAGARVRPHLIASHYGRSSGAGALEWSVQDGAGREVAAGSADVWLEPGALRELAILEFDAPAVSSPARLTLAARLTLGEDETENSWPLWCFPAEPWRAVAPFALVDPGDRLEGLSEIAQVTGASAAAGVLVTTAWDEAVEAFVRGGGRAIVLAAGGERREPATACPLPFWREAIKVLEPHPAWGDFPHQGWTDLQFHGMAPDLALETAGLPGCRPILRRLDARTMTVHDYAAELALGEGRLIASTLRFEGGLGRQPVGVKRNTAAAYLLTCWLRYLQALYRI